MPSGLLNADIGFPAFTGKESTEEKIGQISQYLYMLLEQLKYSLANIGVDNMTSGGVTELTQTVVNTPINITLGGGSPQTNTIGGAINLQSGAIAAIRTFNDGLSLEVVNNADSSFVQLSSNGVHIGTQKKIQFTGDVVFASDLVDGVTAISGSNIKTGTITGITVKSLGGSSAIDDVTLSGGQLVGTHTSIYGATVEDFYLYGNDYNATLRSNNRLTLSSEISTNIVSREITIGGRAVDVFLTGNVYINGVLQ